MIGMGCRVAQKSMMSLPRTHGGMTLCHPLTVLSAGLLSVKSLFFFFPSLFIRIHSQSSSHSKAVQLRLLKGAAAENL